MQKKKKKKKRVCVGAEANYKLYTTIKAELVCNILGRILC